MLETAPRFSRQLLGGQESADYVFFPPPAAQSLIHTLGGTRTGELGGGDLRTCSGVRVPLAERHSSQVRAPRCAARACSCSGSPTAGAAAAAAEPSAWAARLRAAPWRSVPPGGQELRPGAPRGPCCCGRRGGGSGPDRRGARETPREPRALAPCDPPRLLLGLGLHSLLVEPLAVAASESGTKEVEEEEAEATLGRAVPGRIRLPLHPRELATPGFPNLTVLRAPAGL